MVVYNASPYLEGALLRSAFRTFKDMAVIAVDDGFHGRFLEYLRNVKDLRLRVVALHSKSGAGGCVNIGTGLSNSEYAASMDADDISLPNRLERQVEYLGSVIRISESRHPTKVLHPLGRTGFAPPLTLDHDSIARTSSQENNTRSSTPLS